VDLFLGAVKDSAAQLENCYFFRKFDDSDPTGSLDDVIKPGQKLNLDFRLKVVRAGKVIELAFRELLQRRTIVSVYMKNNTPSCDRQNDTLIAHASDFERAGYDLIAVSRDTAGSHQRYAQRKGIRYTLASDPTDAFARATDSLVEKKMYGRTFIGPARAAYVLEPDGAVLAVAEKVETSDHATQLKELLKNLK
jgi:peroxiredoxin Q/BCP